MLGIEDNWATPHYNSRFDEVLITCQENFTRNISLSEKDNWTYCIFYQTWWISSFVAYKFWRLHFPFDYYPQIFTLIYPQNMLLEFLIILFLIYQRIVTNISKLFIRNNMFPFLFSHHRHHTKYMNILWYVSK